MIALLRHPILACAVIAITACSASGQVQVDSTFDTRVTAPLFPMGSGPMVLIDEAHHNAHTSNGRYAPFAALLRSDGFRVEPLRERITMAALQRAAVVVIANAAVADTAPTNNFPVVSAFAPDEIQTLNQWVHAGASLLLIADHPPWAGAAEDIAKSFGVWFANGYAMRQSGKYENVVFRTSDGSLVPHAVTRGRGRSESIDVVVTFTGQAFRAPTFEPVLRIPDGISLFLPERASGFSATTPRMQASGLLQGAVGTFGQGRLAVFGEAAMFSAQLLGPEREPLGMNHPDAAQNKQFVVNVARWLVRNLP